MGQASGWWDSLAAEYERVHTEHKVEELLGQGASAAVFKLCRPEGPAALKIYRPEFLRGASEAAERHRLALHKRLRAHGCCSLVDIYEIGDVAESAYITMEFVPWPSMDSVIGAIPSEAIPGLISEVASAVKWMETHGLVHRDIKPANILVSPDFQHAKLVDFGVIRELDGTSPELTDHGHRRPFIATAQYSSPEYLFRLVEPSEDLWRGLSIYQLGAVLHDMLEGRPLFHEEVLSENRYVLAMAVLKRPPAFRLRSYPVQWAALARRALVKDLGIRIRTCSVEQFLSLGVFDADAARARLGLGTSTPAGALESLRNTEERRRLRVRKLVEELRDKLGHELREEGYQRVRWVEQEEDSVWGLFPIPSDGSFAVSLRVQGQLTEDSIKFTWGAQLDEAECAPAVVECNRQLWEGVLDNAGAPPLDEIVPLISDSLLRLLLEAEDTIAVRRPTKTPVALTGGYL